VLKHVHLFTYSKFKQKQWRCKGQVGLNTSRRRPWGGDAPTNFADF